MDNLGTALYGANEMSDQIFWQHRCPWRGEGICPQCGQQTAMGGLSTVEDVEPLTEEGQMAIIRDKVTIPSLKQLFESGLIGGKTTVTYPSLKDSEE
jgi:hypothetical protein